MLADLIPSTLALVLDKPYEPAYLFVENPYRHYHEPCKSPRCLMECDSIDTRFNQQVGWTKQILISKDFLDFLNTVTFPDTTPMVVEEIESGIFVVPCNTPSYLEMFLHTKGVRSTRVTVDNHVLDKLKWHTRESKKLKKLLKVPTDLAIGPNGEIYEKYVQHRLAQVEKGQVEVSCPVGRIDVLTLMEIIEVKVISNWKDALGQVLSYKTFYPDRSARIHLFGKIKVAQKRTIEKVCGAYAVKVTYEP